ncbi:di-heme oxidoredictase family protein [Radicibacter daui]|uniref:di-heme oxidoredictase family protein n=1 Tax=Radicibacter daui TaxID=3064829 RepID=UPI004046DB74
MAAGRRATGRLLPAMAALAGLLLLAACGPTDQPAPAQASIASPAALTSPLPAPPVTLGGATGRAFAGEPAFGLPAANLAPGDLRDFVAGNRIFNTDWRPLDPARPEAPFSGLGPYFEESSCTACHHRDGRGDRETLLLHLSIAGSPAEAPHPLFGTQLQRKVLPGLEPLPYPALVWQQSRASLAGGETVTLEKPVWRWAGPPPEMAVSARLAPPMIGLGLLAAVPENEIAALADADDKDGDGISGRMNRVTDSVTGKESLGRFGWKASVASLLEQVMIATHRDFGLTSAAFPAPDCPGGERQAACRAAAGSNPTELPARFADQLTVYSHLLSVPERRGGGDPQIARGFALFRSLGCAACHQETLTTGSSPFAELANQTIHPFTDLLLHDMGDGLADGVPQGGATGTEWRTAPLWGLGLAETVASKPPVYLHDGRARTLTEAILWHGGEAQKARDGFAQLGADERAAVLTFLAAL